MACEVEVVGIPGGHDVIVGPPELARRLRVAVEDAQGQVRASTRLGKNVVSVPIDTAPRQRNDSLAQSTSAESLNPAS